MLIRNRCAACCLAILLGSGLHAEDLILLGATVHDGLGGVEEDGAVVISGGRIAALGRRAEVPLPAGARIVDVRGKHVTPGFVDLYSRFGLEESDRRDFGPTESRSVADGLDLFDPSLSRVRRSGTTTVATAPGTSQGAGGLGAVIKLRADQGVILARETHYVASLGVSGERSTTAERLEQFYRLRGLFTQAQAYRKAWEAHWKAVDRYNEETRKRLEAEKKAAEEKARATPPAPAGAAGGQPQPAPPSEPPRPAENPRPPRPPAVEPGKEALARATGGAIPVLVEAHRRDDIELALQLKKEYPQLRLAILGATQAAGVLQALPAAGVSVAVEPVLLDRYALELRDHSERTPALLAAAGIPVVVASPGLPGLEARRLRHDAAAAIRGGLSPEEALSAITSRPAKLLGLEGRVGSLAAGLDADLLVFDGPPLELTSRLEIVCVEGECETLPAPSWSPAADSPSAAPLRSPAREVQRPLPAGRRFALVGGRAVLPSPEGVREIEPSVIVVERGRIVSVEAGEAAPPGEGVTIDVRGRVITPGLIDARSHAGIGGETDDITSALSEELRVVEAFDPWDQELGRLHLNGVTSAALSPGGVNVVGGRISVIKLLPGRVDLRLVLENAGARASLAPALSLPRFPTALSGAALALRDWLGSPRARVVDSSGLLLVEVPSRSAWDRARAMFDRRQALLGVIDPARIPARAWLQSPPPAFAVLGPYSLDDPPEVLAAAAALRSRGARIAFAMAGTRRDLLTSAALAMEAGLSRADALRAVTLWPAELYGLHGVLGEIVPGADADLVVWSADPLSFRGRVERVFIDGEQVFEASSSAASNVAPDSHRPPTGTVAPGGPSRDFVGGARGAQD